MGCVQSAASGDEERRLDRKRVDSVISINGVNWQPNSIVFHPEPESGSRVIGSASADAVGSAGNLVSQARVKGAMAKFPNRRKSSLLFVSGRTSKSRCSSELQKLASSNPGNDVSETESDSLPEVPLRNSRSIRTSTPRPELGGLQAILDGAPGASVSAAAAGAAEEHVGVLLPS